MSKKLLEELDIVISIYNQEKLIERVLDGVIRNTITPFRLILVFDGCTDSTQPVAEKFLDGRRKQGNLGKLQSVVSRVTPNIYETKANNVGFRLVATPYFITIQDDMVIDEYAWEKRLTYPLRRFGDVFAVTSRGAQDVLPGDGSVEKYTNTADRQFGLKRNIFAIRDVINRGPVAFKTDCLKKLNFLNEAYAPCNLDDADLCLRAWRDFGWRAGVLYINYISKLSWGKARAKDSSMNVNSSNQKNVSKLYSDHHDYIDSGIKHSVDYRIEDRDIAVYDGFDLPQPKKFTLRKILGKILRITGFRDFVFNLYLSCKRIYTRIMGIDRSAPPDQRLVYLIGLLESERIGKKRFALLVREFIDSPNMADRMTLIGMLRKNKKIVGRIGRNLSGALKYTVKTSIKNGPIRGLRISTSQMFREFNQKSPWLAYHSLRVAYFFHKTDEDRELLKREKRETAWYQDNGDETLRLDYPLSENSTVLDVGGFKGDWASRISNMYGCNIYVFEPVKEFAHGIKKRFSKNPKVKVLAAALGTEDGTQKIYLEHGSTSLIRKFKQATDIDVVDAHRFVGELGRPIDLIKINIEGAEYDLLDKLIETGDIELFTDIQIQFHDFIPNAVERREKIQNALARTHCQTYNYDFTWENWRKK